MSWLTRTLRSALEGGAPDSPYGEIQPRFAAVRISYKESDYQLQEDLRQSSVPVSAGDDGAGFFCC
jgi:hypothetical protein